MFFWFHQHQNKTMNAIYLQTGDSRGLWVLNANATTLGEQQGIKLPLDFLIYKTLILQHKIKK